MDEDRRIPVNPASTIGAGYGIPIQQPPPIRLPNVGMGAMGMPKFGDNPMVEIRRFIVRPREDSNGGNTPWRIEIAAKVNDKGKIQTTPDGEPIMELAIAGGKVFGERAGGVGPLSEVEVEDTVLDLPEKNSYIWLEIGTNPETMEVTGAFIAVGDELPESDFDISYIRVLGTYTRELIPSEDDPLVMVEDPDGAFDILQVEDNWIFLADGGGGETFAHMWQVESAGMTEADPEAEPPVVAEPRYTVRGGILVVQGTRVDVAAVPPVTHVGNGFVVLSVVRNTTSRVYDTDIPASIQFLPTEPTSSDYEEFTVLAEITSGIITQCRNDEICSHELMLVENGEFKLMPFQTNSRNSYDLPPEPEPEPE